MPHYLNRIHSEKIYKHIPKDVLCQFIYEHHDNYWLEKNYGWMDFTAIKFEKKEWEVSKIKSIKAIEDFENSISGIEDKFNSVSANAQDSIHWKLYGSWRVPPIILNTPKFKANAPNHAELRSPFQLVEGHSPLRNLLIADFQQLFLSRKHVVFLMSM